MVKYHKIHIIRLWFLSQSYQIEKKSILKEGKLIKLKKAIENLPIIMIAVATLLLFINSTKSKQINSNKEIIILILFLFAILLDLYFDVKSKQFSTAKLIIIADVIEVIAFITLCYLNFKSIEKASNELLWERAEKIRHVGLIFILMPSIKSIFKSRRFENK